MLSVQSMPPSSGRTQARVSFSACLRDDVAGPGHGQDDVATDQVLGVLVAGELAGRCPPSTALLISARAASNVLGGRLRRVLAEAEQAQADRVAHLGEERHLALPARIVGPERLELVEVAGRPRVSKPSPVMPDCQGGVVVVGRVEVDADL